MTAKKFWWRFRTIPTPAQVERFIESQVSLFSRYQSYLVGSDGEPPVDTWHVEHNCGVTNLEVQLNGIKGHAGDIFCFPGYFPGDKDEEGRPLYNVCDTGGQWYGKIVSIMLSHAAKDFDMEWTTSEQKAEFYQIEPEWC
jgi:hypothetical protein